MERTQKTGILEHIETEFIHAGYASQCFVGEMGFAHAFFHSVDEPLVNVVVERTRGLGVEEKVDEGASVLAHCCGFAFQFEAQFFECVGFVHHILEVE